MFDISYVVYEDSDSIFENIKGKILKTTKLSNVTLKNTFFSKINAIQTELKGSYLFDITNGSSIVTSYATFDNIMGGAI